jgi:hypothetical protein
MLEQRMFPGDTGLAILQFIDTFGETELRIIAGMDDEDETAYAITDPSGQIISLYNNPELRAADQARGYPLHTAANLVHEFGHGLSFSLGNEMRNYWDSDFRILVVDSSGYFETDLAWRDFSVLENRSTYREDVLSGRMTTLELEEERLANMFQGLVYSHELRLDENDCTALHTPPDPNCIERRAAWVMHSFMTGTCSPSDVFTSPGQQRPPCGEQVTTLLKWVIELGNR